MNHINAPSVEALAECEYGVNEAVPIVHAAAELCGVTFSQGKLNVDHVQPCIVY